MNKIRKGINDDEEEEGPEEEEEEEYVVEAIRAWRYHAGKKRKEFFVKWKDYPENDNTWEPEEHMDNCPKVLSDYVESLTGAEARHFNCQYLDKLNGFSRNAPFKRYVGCDGPHSSDEDENDPKESKQKFYCLCVFEDTDGVAEECTIKEFLENQPEEAWKFLEERILEVGKENGNKVR